MKKILLALVLGLAASMGSEVQADGGCNSPGCNTPGVGAGYTHPHFLGAGQHYTHPLKGHPLFSHGNRQLSRMPTLPVYMAAPWYLYWPYDGHFQTVAPMAYGQWYAPPAYSGNPYLPVNPNYYYPGSTTTPIPGLPAQR